MIRVYIASISGRSSDHPEDADRLIPIAEAALMLGVGRDFLYRRSRSFPFTRRMGRRLLFSAAGIERHIRAAKTP
jgi:predicted DNA-binding transcriptional regulator AlpA